MNWNCPQCSFANHPDLLYCEMCEYNNASTSTTKQDNKTTSNTAQNNVGFQDQVAPARGNSSIVIGGIMEMISTLGPAKNQANYPQYKLCFPYCLHVSQKGTYGSSWSCGYRNIQMLCSSLMRVDEYKAVLFNGTGVVPEIAQLQKWIEKAWQAGFDVDGALQLEGRLVGTNKWIGTTECAALLRYFGVRAVIVDIMQGDPDSIQWSSSTAGTSTGKRSIDAVLGADGVTSAGAANVNASAASMGDRLCAWVHRYLSSRTAAATAGSSSAAPSSTAVVRQPHNGGSTSSSASDGGELKGTMDGAVGAREPIAPPLYFQHEGHSRTIVGLQYAVSTLPDGAQSKTPDNLLIFNPSCVASISQQSLLEGNLRWRTQLCKNKNSFKEDNYQLVYVVPGIMSASEQQRSKVLLNMYQGGEDIGALVADIGSYATRIGFAGEDSPRAFIPSVVGILNADQNSHGSISEGAQSNQPPAYDFDVYRYRENMGIESPIRDGMVVNWDMLEKLWEHSLTKYCGRNDLKDTPVLLAEKPYAPVAARHRMCETMFEKYSAPAVFISKDAVLASYSCGKSGGLVIDIGASGTVVTPVQDGWVETKGMCRSFAGGRLIDAHIRNNVLSKRKAHLVPTFRLSRSVTATEPIGVTATPKNLGSVHPSYDAFMGLELARDIKESLARVADSTLLDADPRYANIPTTPYELPDGTVVEVNIERFQISELLFDPSPMAKLDSPELQALYGNTPSLAPGSMDSVPKIVGDAIVRSDTDIQVMLLSNMILTGGTACIDGLSERLKTEVERLMYLGGAPGYSKTRMVSVGASERALCPWLGGSIVASLGSFHEMWVSKQEYDECGTSIIDRKCP